MEKLCGNFARDNSCKTKYAATFYWIIKQNTQQRSTAYLWSYVIDPYLIFINMRFCPGSNILLSIQIRQIPPSLLGD